MVHLLSKIEELTQDDKALTGALLVFKGHAVELLTNPAG